MSNSSTNPIPYPNHKGVSGIYEIVCTANGKRYIGSAVCLRARKIRHLREMRGNKHRNPHLQSAFNLYGESVFEFRVIELCDISILKDREQFFLDTERLGFNIAPDAFSSMRGRKHTDEWRAKHSAQMKGRKFSEEHKRKIGEANQGRSKSKEWRHKISQTLMKTAARGEAVANSKLTESDVIEIRKLNKQGISFHGIARLFNVYQSTIERIVHRKTWKHI